MEKAKFVKFLGGVALGGKVVAAYKRQDGKIDVRIETIETIISAKNSETKLMTENQFEDFEDRCTEDLNYGDARIVERAMRELGFDFGA